jgi:hypothetical protein
VGALRIYLGRRRVESSAGGKREGLTKVSGLVENLVSVVTIRREFELWEAPGDTHPLVMVASRLTRREAVTTARRHALHTPRLRALVLDARGRPVFRV